MSVHVDVLQTGTVRIHPSHRTQSATRSVLLRRFLFLTDRTWTEKLPINTYLISHPEGYILFDTGESPRCKEPGFFPWWNPVFHISVDLDVPQDVGIVSLLKQRNLEPADVKTVVLSHLHHDHADGISDLPHSNFFVSPDHWNAFKNPLLATLEGALPKQWPKGWKPKLLSQTDKPVGPWKTSYPITSDGRVVAVDTPGHVPGHVCLVVYGDNATYVLGGDVAIDQELLDREWTDGINANPLQAAASLQKIKAFAHEQPIVLLPAHDPDSAARLAGNVVYTPGYSSDITPKVYPDGHAWLIMVFLGLLAVLLYHRRRSVA